MRGRDENAGHAATASLSRAAQESHLSVSAASRRLSLLEHHFRVALLDRTPNVTAIMYTTWQDRYDDLEAFARACAGTCEGACAGGPASLTQPGVVTGGMPAQMPASIVKANLRLRAASQKYFTKSRVNYCEWRLTSRIYQFKEFHPGSG